MKDHNPLYTQRGNLGDSAKTGRVWLGLTSWALALQATDARSLATVTIDNVAEGPVGWPGTAPHDDVH